MINRKDRKDGKGNAKVFLFAILCVLCVFAVHKDPNVLIRYFVVRKAHQRFYIG